MTKDDAVWVESAIQRAFALQKEGRPEEAVAVCRRILELQPRHFHAWNLLGVIAWQSNHSKHAIELFDKAILSDPQSAMARLNHANALLALKRYQAAVASYDKAIALKPDDAAACNNRGIALRGTGQHEAAVASFDRAIAINPQFASAYYNRGNALAACKRHAAAVASYDRAIELKPDYAVAYHNRGEAYRELKDHEAALACFDRAILVKPDYAEAYNSRGLVLYDLRKYEASVASFDTAVALKPDYASACNNRGISLCELQRREAAIASYDRAIALKPDYSEAYNNRGIAYVALKQHEVAVASYDRAIALKPDYAVAYYNRGDALRELQQYEAAVASYDKAIALNSDNAAAYNNRGISLSELQQYEAALASYDRAISPHSNCAEALNNRGNVLLELRQHGRALDSYDQAIAHNSEYAEAYNNRGHALRELEQNEAAVANYDRAIALNPDLKFVHGMRLFARMQMCDWTDIEAEITALADRIERGEAASDPFLVLALSGCAALQKKAARIWVREVCPINRALPAIAKRLEHAKIRVGYFSADFCNHPVSVLTAELFEIHDRFRFEVIAFSFGQHSQDEMGMRLEKGFDRFLDVRTKSDQEIAMLARSLEIDIAVDLGGFTKGSRPRIFALRVAPVQVSYLGYLGTLSAEYMDYLIADATIVPASHQDFYQEKIAFLPSYQANDSKRPIADKQFTREELGLPATGFVFCCFNANYKITPVTFAGWMRILERVEGSVLFLLAGSETVESNLRNEASRRGVNPSRLVFGARLPFPEYLARYRTADLFLDTLPYNAGTTASDALWAGLPVLTCVGDAFAGRVAASLLNAIELPELIAATQEEYEELAVDLATEPNRLVDINMKLARNRLTTALFDTRRFTKYLEAAFTRMYQRTLADLPPEHLHVEPDRTFLVGRSSSAT